MISALTRKLVRDLSRLRGQIITIALVVACGIAGYVMLHGISVSLDRARERYYQRYRFAQICAHLKRAPESLADSIRELPGVMRISTREVESVVLPIEGLPQPAFGTLVSIPDGRGLDLNDVFLRDGRLPERANEVVLHEAFAEAHGLRPGDGLPAILNGSRRELRIVGTGNSPEFLTVPRRPGDLLYDARQSSVLWMPQSGVAPVFRMEGAFNDVCLTLFSGANSGAVEAQLDDMLAPYGGVSVTGVGRQYSDVELSNLIKQFQGQSAVLPIIFLSVAAWFGARFRDLVVWGSRTTRDSGFGGSSTEMLERCRCRAMAFS